MKPLILSILNKIGLLYCRYLLLVLFVILCQTYCFSTVINGCVINIEDNSPVSYANVYSNNTVISTVTCTNGKFSLNLDDSITSVCLTVSHVSYKTSSYIITLNENIHDITCRLTPMAYVLNNVDIRSRKMRRKHIGYAGTYNKKKSFVWGVPTDELGVETGVIIEDIEPCTISKLKLGISSCTIDSVFFRLNIYNYRSNVPESTTYSYDKMHRLITAYNSDSSDLKSDFLEIENILIRPIYISFTSDDISNDLVVIDLKKHDVKLEGTVLITMEVVENLGNGSLVYFAVDDGVTVFKNKSSNSWYSFSLAMAVSLEVLR